MADMTMRHNHKFSWPPPRRDGPWAIPTFPARLGFYFTINTYVDLEQQEGSRMDLARGLPSLGLASRNRLTVFLSVIAII